MKATKRLVTSFVDPDGQLVIKVPMPSGEHALVDKDVFDCLRDKGLTANWNVNNTGRSKGRYVRCKVNGENYSVARVIMDACSGEIVRFVTRNTLDLRKKNMYLTDGYAKRGREIDTQDDF